MSLSVLIINNNGKILSNLFINFHIVRTATIINSSCCFIKRLITMLDAGCDSNGSQSFRNEKLIYPAANRNKEPILQVLKSYIETKTTESRLFLEVASGSGQHLFHFAPHFPEITFQPSEFDDSLLGSIIYYAQNCPSKNILKPKLIDICKNLSEYGYKGNSIDYIYNANMIHISPYKCTVGLFENAGSFLKTNGLMITYGPYSKDGIITPDSNLQFDASLKCRDPSWGLRDLNDLIKLGDLNKLLLLETIEMPANNKILIWRKVNK